MQKVDDERDDIAQTAAAIREFTGKQPRGWLGPGLTETWETPDLLVEEGYDYVCDWVLDDQPVWLKTRTKPIVNLPYTQECNDVAMMLIQHHKAQRVLRPRRSTSSSSSTRTPPARRASWRWSCTPTSWARRTASNTSATPSPTSRAQRTCCSGPASRSSTGIGRRPPTERPARLTQRGRWHVHDRLPGVEWRVTFAALLFLVASGFTLIFGLMRIVNLAHGALYLMGGYIGLVIAAAAASFMSWRSPAQRRDRRLGFLT